MLDSNTDFYGGECEWSDLSDESNLSDKMRTASERDEISGKRERRNGTRPGCRSGGKTFPAQQKNFLYDMFDRKKILLTPVLAKNSAL